MKRISLDKDKMVSVLQITRTINKKHTYEYKFNWVNRCVTTIQIGVRER